MIRNNWLQHDCAQKKLSFEGLLFHPPSFLFSGLAPPPPLLPPPLSCPLPPPLYFSLYSDGRERGKEVGGGHYDRMVRNWSLKSYKSSRDAFGIIPNSLSLSLSDSVLNKKKEYFFFFLMKRENRCKTTDVNSSLEWVLY